MYRIESIANFHILFHWITSWYFEPLFVQVFFKKKCTDFFYRPWNIETSESLHLLLVIVAVKHFYIVIEELAVVHLLPLFALVKHVVKL